MFLILQIVNLKHFIMKKNLILFFLVLISNGYCQTNLISNPGFESGSSSDLWGGSSVVTNDVYGGTYAARLEDNSQWGGGYESVITGLSPSTEYIFSAYVKSSGVEGRIGVKNYGGNDTFMGFSNTAYEQKLVVFTTGTSNTTATVYVYNPVGGVATLYADDLELVKNTPPPTNLVANSGFEVDAQGWNLWSSSRVNNNANTGNYAIGKTSGQIAAEYTVSGLVSGITYQLSAYIKTANSTQPLDLGVKNYGGSQLTVSGSSTTYQKVSLTFVPTQSTAVIFVYRASGNSAAYADDFEVINLDPIPEVINSPGNTNYYLSENGNDTNNGLTSQTAWKSLSKFDNIKLAAGDSILVEANSTFTGTFEPYTGSSGVAGNPIVITKYGSSNYSQRPILNGNGETHTVVINNGEHWEVSNLEVTNPNPQNGRRRGIAFINTDAGELKDIKILNNYVHDVDGDNVKDSGGSMGIMVDVRKGTNPVQSWYDGILIEGNEVVRCDRTGIGTASSWWCRTDVNCNAGTGYVSHENVVIRNNYVKDAGGDGIVPINATGALVEYNIVNGANVNSGTHNVALWCWNSDNVTFQFNEAYNAKGTLDGQGLDVDYGQTGTIFQYNYSHDNEGGFMLITGPGGSTVDQCIVRYNISQNDNTRAFHVTGNVTDCKVYNNVVYVNENLNTKPIVIGSWNGYPKSIDFENNIFHLDSAGTWDKISRVTERFTFDNNIVYGTHTTGEPTGNNNLTNNPMLVSVGTTTSGSFSNGQVTRPNADGYKIQVGSPAIGAGKLIANNGGYDYWGNSVSSTQVPNIGAYSGTPVPGSNPPANLINDPGFETGVSSYLWGGSSVVTNDVYSGTYAARLEDNTQWGGGYESIITGLSPSTEYIFSAYVKSSGVEGRIGVKNYGGNDTFNSFSNTTYEQKSVVFTTGTSNTSAKIYIYNPSGGAATLYADDLELIESGTLSKSSGKKSDTATLQLEIEELESEELDSFRVYPNPAINIFYIKSANNQTETYSVVNVNGQLLLKGKVSTLTEVNITSLKSGLYFLNLYSANNKVKSHKVVVK
jgi:hypothetical protein